MPRSSPTKTKSRSRRRRPSRKIREASCFQCSKKTKSSPNLVFFVSLPDSQYDSYYCGCAGWE